MFPLVVRLAACCLLVASCDGGSSSAEIVGTDTDTTASGDGGPVEATTDDGGGTDAGSDPGTEGGAQTDTDAGSDTSVEESSSGGDTTGGTDGPVASAGCGLGPPAEGYLELNATDGDGATREYLLITPHDYDPNETYALVFHYSHDPVGLENVAGALDDAFFVYPVQSETQWGFGWDDTCGGKDVVFFDEMLAYVEASYCIDTHRVFAAGFSWGADHATTLGCCRASKLRAFAPHASNDEYSDPADYTTYWNYELCEHPSTPPATRYTHQVDGDGAYPAPLFDTTSQLYRWLNGCSDGAQPITPSPCVAYDGCTSSVVECAYPGIGHDYYDGWAQDTWDFFSAFHERA
jgi:poly(3-hydroxybutyrate) depolymerase